MKKNQLTRTQAHQLLMQHKTHYLWNVPYNKWTEEDEANLLNGINSNQNIKLPGNRVGTQPVKVIDEKGKEIVYKSVAECSRKTGITESTIFATINGRRRLKKVKYPLFEKVTN